MFNKGLSEDDQIERLFNRLKNTENKNEVQLKVLKDQGEKQLKELKNINKSKTIEQMMNQMKYYLTLRKQMRHLIMQNPFVQKLMELNAIF